MNRRAAAPGAFRGIVRFALFAALAVAGLHAASLHAQSAKSYYKQGHAAEEREDFDAAFSAYQKAYSMAPKELTYKAAFYRVQLPAAAVHLKSGRRLLQNGDEQGALSEFLRASEIDPSDEAPLQEIAKVRAQHKEKMPANISGMPQAASEQTELDTMAAPVQLKPVSNEPLTLHMVEDSKVVYQAVGKAAGVNILFDPDYTGKRIQVDLNNVSLVDALRIVGTLSNTFWRPVTTNTIFVAANSRSKRNELDEEAVQTFYLTNAWQQNDLTDVQTAIRNVLPNAHAYGVASQNAIVMRGTPDELLLAQKLVNDLDKARPEVVVDIAVLEVSKSWERTLGIAWPQSAGVALQPPTSTTSSTTTTTTGTSTSTAPTLFNLAHLNSNDFAVTIGTATANALLNDSNTKTLQSPRIRSTDGQKASIKIGSRIPIATGSFQSGVGVAAAVTPLAETQFQYIDIGVVIDMTPTVHYNGDVTMKLAIEVSSEGSPVTIEGVTEPIIIQKKSDQTIRLREGEASVLTGIINKQEIQSWTGLPGLSSIPILKYLFGSKDHQITDDEIVFLLVPHIVRSPELTAVNLRPVDTGSGQTIELRRISNDGGDMSMSPVAPPVPTPAAEPAVGTVPGSSSAQAAAPEALAQMRSSALGNGPPPNGTSPGAAPSAASPPGPPGPGGLRLSMVPSSGSTVATGSMFQVPVVITGAHDIASVPLEVKYDPARLALVNVGDGDFLSRDGQTVTLIHTDDSSGGLIKINTARPPGAAGMSGAGVVCVLTFQAKSAGPTTLGITRTGATTSAQQLVPAELGQANLVVK